MVDGREERKRHRQSRLSEFPVVKKLTKCSNKLCRKPYQKFSMTHRACSPECAIVLMEIEKEKKARKAHAAAKVKARTRTEWLRECQAVINQYVRLRDKDKGCCSCDRSATWQGQWHASHFRSVGAASAVRFNLWNINKSCSICNNWKSGNLSDYEPRLREAIGDEKVDWLRKQTHPVKYEIEYLQRLIKIGKKKIKARLACNAKREA